MKNLLLFLLLISFLPASTQPGKPVKKYPSLLWEITGNNLKKPSYLFGTMHVSDKMVFNLDDTFYHALKATDVIALELDPGTWQEHFSKTDRDNDPAYAATAMASMFGTGQNGGQLKMNHFSIDPYIDRVARAYNEEPVNMNSYLYRNNLYKMDFQENTYLDLHLYQTGMKLGKRIASLEDIDSSDTYLKRATRAAMEDKSYKYSDQEYISGRNDKIEDAYRKGDLDMMDSLDNLSSAPKFREIFINERNHVQANSIDTILQHGENVFAAVGAAHLPGTEGVIEILRRKGYKLRPVKIRSQNSPERERIEKLIAPKNFATAYTPDSVVSVQLPGTWINMGNSRLLQLADMANGSYYTLYRLRTSAVFWNETPDRVLKRADSLVYEKIPGKIQSKKKTEVSGYPALSILSLTRRGDLQRYCIVATPFELMVFKMSGNGDYVSRSGDADKFFNSIAIKKLEAEKLTADWSPSWGGFSVRFPHQPAINNKTKGGKQVPFEFTATNPATGTSYNLLREVLQRTDYMEEDSFELNLMDESYASSKMVDRQQSRKFIQVQGYPAMLSTYKLKNGNYSQVLSLIQGPNYYSLVAQNSQPFQETDPVLASFRLKPSVYNEPKPYTFIRSGFSLQSPVAIPDDFMDKKKDLLNGYLTALGGETFDFLNDLLQKLNVIDISNDTIGESIMLSSFGYPKYTYLKDSVAWAREMGKNNEHLLRSVKDTVSNGWQITEAWYSDSNSSRMMHSKTFYRKGYLFELKQYTDTLTAPSQLSSSIFSSFQPADTLNGTPLFQTKGQLFFKEFASKDSAERKSATSNLGEIHFTKAELPLLEKIADTLSWASNDYLSLKTRLLKAFGNSESDEATHFLQAQYEKIKDTLVFQQTILNALLTQKTLASFKAFETLVLSNPPVSITETNVDYVSVMRTSMMAALSSGKNNNEQYTGKQANWRELNDSLSLTRQILPGLMNLLSLEDYKVTIEQLMENMADSNYLDAAVMQPYYSKYLLEAKQKLKKMQAAETAEDIRKMSDSKNDKSKDEDEDYASTYYDDDGGLLARIKFLVPFYKTQPAVKDIVAQGFQSRSDAFKYQLFRALLQQDSTAIPDTLFAYFAKDPLYRQYTYYLLQQKSMLNRIPAVYRNADSIAAGMAKNLVRASNDTIILAGVKNVLLKGRSGSVYVYKYRKGASSNPWHWAVVGMLPKDSLITDAAGLDLTNSNAGIVQVGKNDKQEVDRLIKEAIYGLRPCADSFYDSSGQVEAAEDEYILPVVDEESD